MDNTTLDFLPSGVLPLIPFLALVALLECIALSFWLVLFWSLFAVVLLKGPYGSFLIVMIKIVAETTT